VKREHESTDVRAQKMMKGRMEPFLVLRMVWAVATIICVVGQIIEVP
jgi:hypothetical protein